MSSYQYRDPHVKDKTVSRRSYLSHGNPHTWKRQSLYRDWTQGFHTYSLVVHNNLRSPDRLLWYVDLWHILIIFRIPRQPLIVPLLGEEQKDTAMLYLVDLKLCTPISPVVLNSFGETWNHIFIYYNMYIIFSIILNTSMTPGVLSQQVKGDRNMLILHSQYQGCWWHVEDIS